MKVGVRAKLAEPPARGPDKSRALRAIDGKHAEAAAADVSSGSAAFGVRAADDFSLESVPVEAPRSGRLRLLPGGRAVLRADSRAGASGETGVLDRDERSRSTDSATRDADAADHEPASETALESEPASESTTSESIEPAASETSDAAAPGAEQAPVAVETPAASDVAAAAPGLTPAISPAPVEALAPAQPASAVARSPSDVARELEALPPSAQADAYGGLGSALDAALGAASTEAASVVPELSAALPGGAEPVVVNEIATPDAGSPLYAAVALDTNEPTAVIPAAPELAPVAAPELPSSYPVSEQTETGEAAPAPDAIGDVLVRVDAAPEIPTELAPPEIPLDGAADPAQLGAIESGATESAALVLADARAGVDAVPADVLQPLALDESVAATTAPSVEPLGPLAPIAGMDELASYELGPADRAAFDAQVGPQLQASSSAASSQLEASEQGYTATRAEALDEAERQRATAQATAETQRQAELDAAHDQLEGERERVASEQELAVDGQLTELANEREQQAGAIDARLESDRASIDASYAATRQQAEAEVDAGSAQADAERERAQTDSESQSWWDWTIDAWQSFVQSFADQLTAVWEGVIESVAAAYDAVIAVATDIVNAAVAFAKWAIAAYYDKWRGLIEELLGSIFPELAAQLLAVVDQLQTLLFAGLDWLAGAFLAGLRFIADSVVATLSAGLAAYRAGVAGYLALWEAVQQGEWAAVGTALVTALLVVAEIAPEEFFAMFGKLDEILAILADHPNVVVVNAIEALSLGFKQFGEKFLDHFMAAAVEWITNAVSITMPDRFDLAGLFDVVRQILGLTTEYLRAKAVQHLGEGAVTAIEQLYAALIAFIQGGWAGLWEYVKEGLTSVLDDAVMALGSWLVEKAILVAGRWIAGLAATMGFSAIIEGLIALWQFVMWLKDQFHRFYDIIRTTIDSVHDFVTGNIQPAADAIEATLENLIPPAIDLVAKLLNIGNIASKVQEVIEAIRKAVDEAIEKVIASVKGKLGLGGKDEKKEADQPEGEAESDPVYGALLRKRAITLEGEEHHLYVTGQPGRFDLVIASDQGPAEDNDVVKGNDEALQAALLANDELGKVNADSSVATRTDAEDARLANEVKQADVAIGQVVTALGGPADSRRGPFTLESLKEPPVPEERSAEEMVQDLEGAQAVLMLAEKQVEDTAGLADYFEAIQRRFRLTEIRYVPDGTGGVCVRLSINPELRWPPERLVMSGSTERLAVEKRTTPPDARPAREALGNAAFGADIVGVSMAADPLGPDHALGKPTTGTEQQTLMDMLGTGYKRGHLLNADLGGLNSPENLFPITASANGLHEARAEKAVKNWVNIEKWYVYYKVEIRDIKGYPPSAKGVGDGGVDCNIVASTAILTTDGQYTDRKEVTIPSRYDGKESMDESENLRKIDLPPTEEIAKNIEAKPEILPRREPSNLEERGVREVDDNANLALSIKERVRVLAPRVPEPESQAAKDKADRAVDEVERLAEAAKLEIGKVDEPDERIKILEAHAKTQGAELQNARDALESVLMAIQTAYLKQVEDVKAKKVPDQRLEEIVGDVARARSAKLRFRPPLATEPPWVRYESLSLPERIVKPLNVKPIDVGKQLAAVTKALQDGTAATLASEGGSLAAQLRMLDSAVKEYEQELAKVTTNCGLQLAALQRYCREFMAHEDERVDDVKKKILRDIVNGGGSEFASVVFGEPGSSVG